MTRMFESTEAVVRSVNGKRVAAMPPLTPVDSYQHLLDRIEARTARVGIIGLGYVGLPLARTFSDNGFAVLGFDTDPAKVAALTRGEGYLKHIPAESVQAMRRAGFEATDRMERLKEADAVLICVP